MYSQVFIENIRMVCISAICYSTNSGTRYSIMETQWKTEQNWWKFAENLIENQSKILKISIYNSILIIALKPVTSLQNVTGVPLFIYIEVSTPYFLYALETRYISKNVVLLKWVSPSILWVIFCEKTYTSVCASVVLGIYLMQYQNIRNERCKKLLTWFQKNPLCWILFTDKKMFRKKEKFNRQNDHVYAKSCYVAKGEIPNVQRGSSTTPGSNGLVVSFVLQCNPDSFCDTYIKIKQF